MNHNGYPAKAESVKETVQKLRDAAQRRETTHPRNLAPASPPRLKTVEVSKDQEPLAAVEHYSGNLQEALQAVVIMGDTMLGVSQEKNLKPEADGRIEKIRIFAFSPDDAAGNRVTSRTIATVDRPTWERHYAEHVGRAFSVPITRGGLAQATGVLDGSVSRDHATIDIGMNGDFRITDNGSSNGTQLLDVHDFDPQHGLDPAGQQDFANFRNELQSDTHLWTEQNAGGKPVIRAQ